MRSLLGEITHQLSQIGGEIVHQVAGSPKKKSPSHKPTYKHHNRDLQKELYKLKQAAFEAKKDFEIKRHEAKSKGWL